MAPQERLRAWQHCHRLTLAVFNATDRWPVPERCGLTSQARRAAFSATVNIVDGCAPRGPAELRRRLEIARASLAELTCTLRCAKEVGYLSAKEWGALRSQCDEAGRTLWGLMRSVSRRWPSSPPTRRSA